MHALRQRQLSYDYFRYQLQFYIMNLRQKITPQHNSRRIRRIGQRLKTEAPIFTDPAQIMEHVEMRGCTFYRIGYRSYQKDGNRRAAAEAFNLKAHQMRGTMYIGELLSNKQISKFMRENKVTGNRLKLIDKLSSAKRQSEGDFSIGTSISASTTDFPKVMETRNRSLQHMGWQLQRIRMDLKALKTESNNIACRNQLKEIENEQRLMEGIEKRYYKRQL